MKPLATARRARHAAKWKATALENRDRLRALVLAAHNATRRCERLFSRSPGPLDLRALREALEGAISAASRARNRAILDAKAEAEQEADR